MKLDPIVYTIPFEYKTGRQEKITQNHSYYDDDEYVYVTHKFVQSVYEQDEIGFHYSGDIEILNKTGFFSQFPDFKYIHKSIVELAEYLYNSGYLVIKKYENHHDGFVLTDEGYIDFKINRMSIEVNNSWGGLYIRSRLNKCETFNDIETANIDFYRQFAIWLYNIDKTLNCEEVYSRYCADLRLVNPDHYYNNFYYNSKQHRYPTPDEYEEVYEGYCQYKRHKQDADIAKLHAQIAELEKLKYKEVTNGFNI